MQFGLIGAHPAVLYLLQVAANVTAVLLLYAACRRASAMPALVSLTLLLAGVVLLERAADGRGAVWTAGLALVASGLTYEASLAPAVAAVVVIPWLCTRRFLAVRQLVALEAALVATGVGVRQQPASGRRVRGRAGLRCHDPGPRRLGAGVAPVARRGAGLRSLPAFAILLVVGHAQRDVNLDRAGDDSVRVLTPAAPQSVT